MAPYDSASFCKSAVRAYGPAAAEPARRVQGSLPLETSIAGSDVFDAASLEPLMDVIKDAPRQVQASIYVFYCEAILNVIHHAYSDKMSAPKFWWTAALKIDPATYRYIFTVADEGRGLDHVLPCAAKGDAHVRRWSELLEERCMTRKARGQGLASFTRLAQAMRGARLTVESNSARCTYSEDAGAEVSSTESARKGVRVMLDLAPETVGGVA